MRRSREALERRVSTAERELGASSRELRLLGGALDTVDEAVVVVDRDGGTVFRNEAAARFDRARHGDAVAEELVERLLRGALDGTSAEDELPLFGPPREVMRVRAVPLERDGELIGAAAFVRDVTELRRVESVRRDFVANVSHELKTPLGALGLLAETIATGDDPVAARTLSDQLVREVDRLARIVDDLLDLSMVEAQEAPLREQVQVRVLLSEAVQRVHALALGRGIPVRELPVPDDLIVVCDSRQIVSAVTNLLDNAVKYSDDGAPVEISATREGASVVVEVVDHGMGVPTKDLDRIFERFYRVDKARSRTTGGTGLGLSIVRHVAQVHGGDVSVESREGGGSTFRLVLPLADAAGGGMAEAS